MVTEICMTGDESLIIFARFIDYIGSSKFEFGQEVIENLLKQRGDLFIERVENGDITFESTTSRKYLYYKELKEEILDLKTEDKDFEDYDKKELEKIRDQIE